MKEVEIYTDGACSGNPGPGGWGAVLLYQGRRKELSGAEKETTNQRMELKAAIEALSRLKYPCRVKLYSDSAYLVNAFNQNWFRNWEKNGWVTAKKPQWKTRIFGRNFWRSAGSTRLNGLRSKAMPIQLRTTAVTSWRERQLSNTLNVLF